MYRRYFAGWEHMLSDHPIYQSSFSNAWPHSHDLLSRSVALPVMIGWSDDQLSEYIDKIRSVFSYAHVD